MELVNPYFLLLLIPFLLLFFQRSRRGFGGYSLERHMLEPRLIEGEKVRIPRSSALRRFPQILRFLFWGVLIVVLCNPLWGYKEYEEEREVIDIYQVMDFSGSMNSAVGSRPRGREPVTGPLRYEVIKEIAKEFIEKRKGDRLGIITFSTKAGVSAFLTFDQGNILGKLDGLSPSGVSLGGGTEPGEGLFLAFFQFYWDYLRGLCEKQGMPLEETRRILGSVKNLFSMLKDYLQFRSRERIRKGEIFLPEVPQIKNKKEVGKGKVVILLSDGDFPSSPLIDPFDVIEWFRIFGIRLYIICIHSTPQGIEEAALSTGGRYYLLPSLEEKARLREIYNEIDFLEKVKVKMRVLPKRRRIFRYFAWGTLLLVLGGASALNRKFRIIP